jgi:hypothetical protein
MADRARRAEACRAEALRGYEASEYDYTSGRVTLRDPATSHLLPRWVMIPTPEHPAEPGTFPVTVDWRVWSDAQEKNRALLVEARGLMEQVQDTIERLAKRLQRIQDGGMSGRYARRLGFGGDSRGQWFVPDAEWFESATPEDIRKWWNRMEPWQCEAMAAAIPGMGLDEAAVNELLVNAMRDVEASGSEADIADLTALLGLFAQDEEATAGMLATAGGGTVATVLGLLGLSAHKARNDHARRRALTCAEELRRNVAQASQAVWSHPEIMAFADELARAVPWEAASVGFLFADQDGERMSVEFTLAMADRLDALERGPDPVGPPNLGVGGATYLAHLDGDNLQRTHDPMARVLQTLGAYPEAALDWLTDPAQGSDRVQYYYGTRNSGIGADGSGDGFEGVAALWAGAQRAEGSVIDEMGVADDGVRTRLAVLSTQIFEHLAENNAMLPENLSPGGARQISTAVMQQLPQIAENGVLGEPNGDITTPVHCELVTGETVPVVNATKKQIAAVIGPALTFEEGAAVARKELADFRRQALAAVDDGVMQRDEARITAGLPLRVHGALEGARMSALLDAAHRDDEAARKLVDQASGPLIGAAGAVAEAVAKPVRPIVQAVGGAVTETVKTELADAYSGELATELERARTLDQYVSEQWEVADQKIDGTYGTGTAAESRVRRDQEESFTSTYEKWRYLIVDPDKILKGGS